MKKVFILALMVQRTGDAKATAGSNHTPDYKTQSIGEFKAISNEFDHLASRLQKAQEHAVKHGVWTAEQAEARAAKLATLLPVLEEFKAELAADESAAA